MLKNIISDKNYGLNIQGIPSDTIRLKYVTFKPEFNPKVVYISSSQRRFSGKQFLSSFAIDKCGESPKIDSYDIPNKRHFNLLFFAELTMNNCIYRCSSNDVSVESDTNSPFLKMT